MRRLTGRPVHVDVAPALQLAHGGGATCNRDRLDPGLDHVGRRPVPPMSPAARERLQVFADEHVKTSDFLHRLAETRRRMTDEQAHRTD